MEEQTFTPKDVAAKYKVGLRTVGKWISSDRIPYMKIGRSVRFTSQHLAQFERAHTVKPVG